MTIGLIVATVEPEHGIGYKKDLAFSCAPDRKHFNLRTKNSILVMGRITFESLPAGMRANGRQVLVLATQPVKPQCTIPYTVVDNLDKLTETILQATRPVWICGGTALYTWAMGQPWLDTLEWTQYHLTTTVPCDTFFHPTTTGFVEAQTVSHTIPEGVASIRSYNRPNLAEQKYLKILNKLLSAPQIHGRNGWTRSLFGTEHLSFDLKKGFPLLTARRIWFKGVVGELLFFLSGKTDTRILEKDKIHIWQGNTRREFLDRKGLPYVEGDMGPGYGFQWRHWGAEYKGAEADYTGAGIDQIALLIRNLKADPFSRRHILSAWNVADLSKMALEPCHILAQFAVRKDHHGQHYLSTHVFMRSCDAFHGLPFNIASYALLNHILCQECGYLPDTLTMSFGDIHIYAEHQDAVVELLTRTPRQFPQVILTCPKDGSWQPENITLLGYSPGPDIKTPMVV